MTALDILLIILVASAIVLCVYLIFSLKKINVTLNQLQNDVHNISEKTLPILDNLQQVSEKINNITERAANQINDLTNSIQKVKDKIFFLKPRDKKSSSENPVNNLIKNLSAVSKGIIAFWQKLRS